MNLSDKHLGDFMRESNWIEGERKDGKGILHERDLEGARHLLNNTHNLKNAILDAHKILFKDRLREAGQWRKVPVSIGGKVKNNQFQLDALMMAYCEHFEEMDAWEAYLRFQEIHPFEDGNGRIGRLIWLSKMKDYSSKIGFLGHCHYHLFDV